MIAVISSHETAWADKGIIAHFYDPRSAFRISVCRRADAIAMLLLLSHQDSMRAASTYVLSRGECSATRDLTVGSQRLVNRPLDCLEWVESKCEGKVRFGWPGAFTNR